MEWILLEISGDWLPTLPKIVKEYLQVHTDGIHTGSEADRTFHEYCNQVRMAYKFDVR